MASSAYEVPLEGSLIRILPGRQFDAFRGGQRGVVLEVFQEAGNCVVSFDGSSSSANSTLVAFRHLEVLQQCEIGSSTVVERNAENDLKKIKGFDTENDLVPSSASIEKICKPSCLLAKQSENDTISGSTKTIGPVIPIYDSLSKWKGCALGSDGKLYCAPYNANVVLVIDPGQDGKLSYIGDNDDNNGDTNSGISSDVANSFIPTGDCKWSGIAAGVDGRLYCAPCHANSVLVIDCQGKEEEDIVKTDRTSTASHNDGTSISPDPIISHIHIPDHILSSSGASDFKWSGITGAADGCLYCAPARAEAVLKIEPKTKQILQFPEY